MGLGKASVYKYIPEYLPDDVGAACGLVGTLGALGGFFLLLAFGYLQSSAKHPSEEASPPPSSATHPSEESPQAPASFDPTRGEPPQPAIPAAAQAALAIRRDAHGLSSDLAGRSREPSRVEMLTVISDV